MSTNAKLRPKGWRKINPLNLPDPAKLGPLLVTNNLTARNAFGQMSHIWLCKYSLHWGNESEGVCMFNDVDQRLPQGLTHYRRALPEGGR